MSNTEPDQKMLDAATAALDASCDKLDGQTLSRLNKIRHEALELPQQRWGRTVVAPFGGLVAASVLVVMLLPFWNQNPITEVPSSNSAMEDLEILISSDSLEFYEDFEFYQWLEENAPSV
jgi:hypothetical protein